jgi:ribosomal protein L37E
VRLFKRKKTEVSLCPRCSQVVTEADQTVCPMCGWDLRDAYQGAPYRGLASDARAQDRGTSAASDFHDDEHRSHVT